MKTFKSLAILTMALTSIAAHAEDAVLGSLFIDRGFAPQATMSKLRNPDGNSFKITGLFTNFSWTVLAGTRIPASQVRQLNVTIRAKKVSGSAALAMFNVRTSRWERIRVLDVPTHALGFISTPILQNASSYVGNGGKIRVRVESIGHGSMFFDYLQIGVER